MNDRPRYYRLIGQTPVACTALEFSLSFSTEDRSVAATEVGPFRVSTVFMGLDHRWSDGPPLLFETKTFFAEGPTHDGNPVDGRDSTWLEAEDRHKRAVKYCVDRLAEPHDTVTDMSQERTTVTHEPSQEERDQLVARYIKAGVCPFDNLRPGESIAHCPLGFPGCGCADELMLNPFLLKQAMEDQEK